MIKSLKSRLSSHLINFYGWKTSRRILVIESDDWGSIRMPSAEAYQNMLTFGVSVNKCPYNRFDKLESKEDMEALFETLALVKDSVGNPAKLTANTIVANPDFDRIAASGFQNYYYELFTETYKRYYPSVDVLSVIEQGRKAGVYQPQFHGREHLNVNYWMQALQDQMPETHHAFGNRLFGISKNISTEKRSSFLSAYDFRKPEETEAHKQIISEGLDIFEQVFGFKSLSFIAPNYTWHPSLEKTLKEKGVEIIQGARAQQVPTVNGIEVKKNKMGALNEFGQVYLIRNVQFEPTGKPGINWVEKAFQDVSTAFFYGKPAVISSHRLNFMGGMEVQNRDKNLALLNRLLTKITRKYPSVEFMSSDQLGELILSEKASNNAKH